MARVLSFVRSHAPGARTVGVVIGVTLLAEMSMYSPSQASAQKDATSSSQAPSMHVEQHVTTDSNSPVDTAVSTHQSVSSSSSQSSSASSTPSNSSSVFINGKEVPVPPNGEIHQTVTNANGGQTHIDVSMQSNSTVQSNGSSHTSMTTFTQTQNQNSTTVTGP